MFPNCIHDGASAKFSTNSQETDYSVYSMQEILSSMPELSSVSSHAYEVGCGGGGRSLRPYAEVLYFYTLQRQNTEISKQIFPEKEYRGLS